MIRFTPWGAAASDLVTKPVGRRSAHVLTRFAAPARSPVFWTALSAAALAAELGALAPVVWSGGEPVEAWQVVFRLVGGSFAACGILAWRRRPDSRSGLLMTATGFGFLASPLLAQLSAGSAQTASIVLQDMWTVPFAALLLTFLTGGRLASKLDRWAVASFV